MSTPSIFQDRQGAGEKLAQMVAAQAPTSPVIVYALPRGGIPVAVPIAHRLNCPLEVMVAKKITEPDNPELAIGAVTADGQVIWASYTPTELERSPKGQAFLAEAQQKAQVQLAQLTAGRTPIKATGAIALLVDDGIATGMTMAVAVKALRQQKPREIWICTPVAPESAMQSLQQWAERVFVVANPEPFYSVGRFYSEFPQVSMQEACHLLTHIHTYQPH